MKPESYKDRIAAFNADVDAKLKAISAALSPEERALREERQKQIAAQATRVISAFKSYPHALTAALSHGALPIQGPADPRVSGDREFQEYETNLLGRLGLEATLPVTVQQMWKAARSVGFTPKEFGSMSPVDLCEVLEAKATVLERLRGTDYTDVQHVLQEGLNVRGGRRPGTPVDGKKLKGLRNESHTSQDGLACTCEVSIDSIVRGERGDRWSDDVFKKVASGLSTVLNRHISSEDLKGK